MAASERIPPLVFLADFSRIFCGGGDFSQIFFDFSQISRISQIFRGGGGISHRFHRFFCGLRGDFSRISQIFFGFLTDFTDFTDFSRRWGDFSRISQISQIFCGGRVGISHRFHRFFCGGNRRVIFICVICEICVR